MLSRLRQRVVYQQIGGRVCPVSFTTVGVNYFGPFEVKTQRSMMIIFTCLAVHIELESSLDTDLFINAL